MPRIPDRIRSLVGLNEPESDSPTEHTEATSSELTADAPAVTETQNSRVAAPNEIEWHTTHGFIEEEQRYFRTYIIESWPSTATDHMFWDILSDTQLTYDMEIHLDRHDELEAVSMLDDLADGLDDKATGGLSEFTLNPESIKRTAQVVKQMKERIEQKNQNLFSVSVHITLYTESKQQLEKKHNEIVDKMKLGPGVKLSTMTYEQDIGLRASGPLGYNEYTERHGDDVSQLMTGEVAATMFPYVSDNIVEQGGVNMGTNLASNTPTFIDPYNRPAGYHFLRLGRTGSGKTFSGSLYLLKLAQAVPDISMTIIDPMGDFVGVNHALGGKRVLIDGNENINPLQIKPTPEHILERAEGQINPYRMKLRDAEWFFERYFSIQDNSLDAQRRAILSMATKEAYNQKGITEDPSTHTNESPTITDVLDILTEMNKDPAKYAEPETDEVITKISDAASDLIIALQGFRPGNRYANLAKPTSIDFSDRDITYIDMTAVPARNDTTGLMMQLLFSLVYQEAKQRPGPYLLTIDEAHKVLQDTDSVGFLEEVFRHGRHFDLGVQLISQTFEEFFVNESAKTIARQCSMVQLHQMERIDKDLAREAMELNERQIQYIQDLQPGDGDKNYSEAILDVSDKGTIPLRISANQNEIAVIDYDPGKDWRELPEPRSQAIKQALDQRQQHDAPLVDPAENKLSQAVLNEILEKQQNIQATLIENGVNPADFLNTSTNDPPTPTPTGDTASRDSGSPPAGTANTDGGTEPSDESVPTDDAHTDTDTTPPEEDSNESSDTDGDDVADATTVAEALTKPPTDETNGDGDNQPALNELNDGPDNSGSTEDNSEGGPKSDADDESE